MPKKERDTMSKKTKRYLMLLVAVGLIAVAAGGSGTFATFNAETANTGNTFATGTLLLHNNGGTTTCTSEQDSGNVNVQNPTGCDILFTKASIIPGTLYTANLKLSNAGTLDASGIKFALGSTGCVEAKPTIATNGVALTATQTPSTITLTNLNQALLDGTQIELHQGTSHAQTYTVLGDYSAGASVPVTLASPAAANFSYTTTATVSLAAFGSGTLCADLQVYVQEKDGGFVTDAKCVYGLAQNSTTCDPTPVGFPLSGIGTSYAPVANNLPLAPNASGNTLLQLTHKQSRYFVIGILAPSSLANANQNDMVTFDLKWRIDQAA
jgi:hypothetical protein